MLDKMEPRLPNGMVVVSKDEFFTRLAAEKRDIMPRHTDRDHTDWCVVNTREVWGWSQPGWATTNVYPSCYAVRGGAE